ncbi:MAG TPA: alpha-amylase family glycosyl hydrolase [Solirubrobacteraceae bacterium]|nr:alpha-amylase family glycosyl hydrolase [Solirubrobacteraceae bacterium]
MSVCRRAVVVLALAVLSIAPAAALAGDRGHGHGHGKGHGDRSAHRSLRQPVTDQNFYFVMADRFSNGATANDNGGLPPGKAAGQSGFDPTGKGWYHGGDLKGLTSKIDYIKGLGTTALWLTPSFKNKAVQPQDNSAGYHGYWITDFTQIDPHLGSNQDLRTLVNAAHSRGIKVYFDIITNHTADVIGYGEGAAQRKGYTSKDQSPYRTASGAPFDDRDYADGSPAFPALAPTGQPSCSSPGPVRSFPYTPCVPAAEQNIKVPAWLNDVSLYHNRGDTTFVGENSLYGDFFGLDDLFTENPRVVDGMIDIYETWIRDFRIDGFRMDTMKHVNDEFWQKFSPAIVDYAKAQGIDDFYMFGEVAEDFSQPFLSHFTTHDDVQGVLDFPFQMSAVDFAGYSRPTSQLQTFFENDDWYTDGDSNVYNLPTFLGNHDRGRIGMFLRNANPGAPESELLARDELAHALMYLSRGNPVVYYGDEQGFTGAGGDQDARQDMFPSQSPQYNNLSDPGVAGDDGAGKNDNIGSDVTPMVDNFDPGHALYRELATLAAVTKRHPALRDGAQQHRFSTSTAGVYAFSRIDRSRKHEYVVALNNAEQTASASVPTFVPDSKWEKVWGRGDTRLRTGADRELDVTLAPLSAVVYRSQKHIPRSRQAPQPSLDVTPSADRTRVAANVPGTSFYEVTFLAKAGNGPWRDIGTDDNAPYRVFQDTSDIEPGTQVSYKAVVLDNAGHTRTSAVRSATIPPPVITLETPNEGQRVRGTVEVRSVATPEHSDYVVTVERSVNGGPFTAVGSDDSSPVYTVFDDTSSLPDGAKVTYRAVLTYSPGKTVTSGTRSVTIVQAKVAEAVVHYKRTTDTDYARWGLHLFGDGLAPGEATAEWTNATPFEGSDGYGVLHRIKIADDTKRVGVIVHQRPPNDPNVKDTDPDRYFIPLATPEIWLKQGDGRIFSCPAANDTCVVPSAS